MLIRLANDDVVEYPDELGILVLADPSCGDVPDFSLEELNCVISGSLGVLYDESLSLDQNIAEARVECTKWGSPTPANLEKARVLIEYYNKNVARKDVGISDIELIKAAYGIVSPEQAKRKVFNHEPVTPVARPAILSDASDTLNEV